jgi:hypothetical protein
MEKRMDKLSTDISYVWAGNMVISQVLQLYTMLHEIGDELDELDQTFLDPHVEWLTENILSFHKIKSLIEEKDELLQESGRKVQVHLGNVYDMG